MFDDVEWSITELVGIQDRSGGLAFSLRAVRLQNRIGNLKIAICILNTKWEGWIRRKRREVVRGESRWLGQKQREGVVYGRCVPDRER